MKILLEILKNDIKSISKRFFALALALGICFLPALYAWVNIYANGNPYENTGNVPIAVASNDTGANVKGKNVNKANEVIESLRESDSIDWQILDSEDEAVEGVKSGKYYAAVIFEDSFTYSMYHPEKSMKSSEETITYYENQKKNAVAAKITDTASSKLLHTINETYLETALSTVFTDAKDFKNSADIDKVSDQTIKRLKEMKSTLQAYDASLAGFISNNSAVRKSLKSAQDSLSAKRKKTKASLSKAKQNFTEAKDTVKALNSAIDTELKDISATMDALHSNIEAIKKQGDVNSDKREKLINTAKKNADTVLSRLEALRAMLPEKGDSSGSQAVKNTLDTMILHAKNLDTLITKIPDDFNSNIEKAEDLDSKLRSLQKAELRSSFKTMLSNLNTTLNTLKPLLSSLSGMLDDVDPVLDSAGQTVGSIDVSLKHLHRVLESSCTALDDAIDKLEAASEDERLEILLNIFTADPAAYSRYFSTMVDVKVNEVYHVANYGAAMTPFYSVLALWVGGVILVSLIKTAPDRKLYPGASEAQLYFGRFLLFFLLGQLQVNNSSWRHIPAWNTACSSLAVVALRGSDQHGVYSAHIFNHAGIRRHRKGHDCSSNGSADCRLKRILSD